MREYYARFFEEVWTQFKLFGKEQIVVGAIAAIVQIFREGQTGTIGRTTVLPSVAAALFGYGVVCLVKFAWIAIHAPVKLDQQRASEIEQQKEDLAHAEAALQQERTRKHPHDEHLENIALAAIGKLEAKERDCLKWFLDVERADNSEIQRAGFYMEPLSILAKCGGTHLVMRHADNTSEYFYVNPKFLPTLKELFHPSGPVTTPPA